MPVRTHIAALLLLCVLCCSISCRQKQHHNVTRGFYYWKTVYRPTLYELARLRKLQVRKMYIRLFDVDWEESSRQPIPIAPIQLPSKVDSGFEYVPVVFITQKTLANLKEAGIPMLAKSISVFAGSLCGSSGILPSEIQIDCDWTVGTKELYFRLLKELKQQNYFKGKTLSCTIRMHQVKYTTSSGIPPVDKGLLMCYSMGDLKQPGTRNSILDVSDAKEYLKRINTYELPLDIALPIFQWCILFRDQQFRGILHELTTDAVTGSKLFEHKKDNLYSCKADTLWQGYTLKEKDLIRVESTSYKELSDIAGFTSKQLLQQNINVLLFSCDSITLAKYSTDELESVYNAYR